MNPISFEPGNHFGPGRRAFSNFLASPVAAAIVGENAGFQRLSREHPRECIACTLNLYR
jgi:hypothetical protein